MTPGWPSNRYAEITPEVRALCERFGFRYSTGSHAHLTAGVCKTTARLALPGRKSASGTGSTHGTPLRTRTGHRATRAP